MTHATLHSKGYRLLAAAAAACLIAATPARAADDIDEAKALYTAASYEEALNALGENASPEALEYRSLCLMALGRTAEAEQAIEALVTTSPSFGVSASDRPPRFVALFTSTRQRVLPVVLRNLFAEARSQYQAKSYTAAAAQFTKVLTLTADPVLKDTPETADMKLLAESFSDLLRANTAAAAPAVAAATGSVPAVGAAPTAPAGSTNATPGRTTPTTSAARAAAPAGSTARARVDAAAPPSVMQPAALKKPLPPLPPSLVGAARGLTGALRLRIGADGKVKAATIERSLHPQYDLELLSAARFWQFTPATINGVPIEAEQIVPVQIMPRDGR